MPPVASCYRNSGKLQPDGPLGLSADLTFFYLTLVRNNFQWCRHGYVILHKYQFVVGRTVIVNKVFKMISLCRVTELTKASWCVEIKRVTQAVFDAHERAFQIVCCHAWHYSMLKERVLRDHRVDDCVRGSGNLKVEQQKYNLSERRKHNDLISILFWWNVELICHERQSTKVSIT